MIESGLLSYILADASFSSLCGSRLYSRTPPNTNAVYPYATWQRIASPYLYTHEGGRMADATWQFVAVAKTPDSAMTAMDALMNAVNLYYDAVMRRVFAENRIDRYDAKTDLHSVLAEFSSYAKE